MVSPGSAQRRGRVQGRLPAQDGEVVGRRSGSSAGASRVRVGRSSNDGFGNTEYRRGLPVGSGNGINVRRANPAGSTNVLVLPSLAEEPSTRTSIDRHKRQTVTQSPACSWNAGFEVNA